MVLAIPQIELKMFFRNTEIVPTWVISQFTSIVLETVIKVGLINLSFLEHAERTASINQKDRFYICHMMCDASY